MCLAIPAKILEIKDKNMAVVDLGGVEKKVSLQLLDTAKKGEYVLIHAGFAISKIAEDEALETLAIFKDMQT